MYATTIKPPPKDTTKKGLLWRENLIRNTYRSLQEVEENKCCFSTLVCVAQATHGYVSMLSNCREILSAQGRPETPVGTSCSNFLIFSVMIPTSSWKLDPNTSITYEKMWGYLDIRVSEKKDKGSLHGPVTSSTCKSKLQPWVVQTQTKKVSSFKISFPTISRNSAMACSWQGPPCWRLRCHGQPMSQNTADLPCVILWNQPKQCTYYKGKTSKWPYTCIKFDPPKMGNLMTPALVNH